MGVDINITGDYLKNGVPIGGDSNPSVVALSATDGTIVTGTTADTLSRSLLIPANTYTGNGILEVLCRMTKTGTAGTSIVRVYKNTSNTLTGATLIALCLSGGSTATTHAVAVRSMRINSNTLTSYTTSTISLSDYFTGTGSMASTTFNTSVDNYILFSIQLANVADSANISMARAIKSV